tara:strand:+ start:1511 stop:2332 length:822 start_codon:yes stop_codon:yes gene_type:complete
MRNNEDRFNPVSAPQQAPATGLQYVVPTEVVELPSKGLFYPEGHPLHEKGFIEIKHMTTKEEDILTSTSLIEKGIVLDYLLKSIIIDKEIDPKSLLPGDQNAIYLSARLNAYGSDYSFNFTCDACGKLNKVDYNLENVENKKLPEDSSIQNGLISLILEKSNFTVKLKQLSAKDAELMEKQNKKNKSMGVARGTTTSLLLSIIYSINDEINDGSLKFINVIESLPSKDVRQIKKTYLDTKPDVDFAVELKCSSCGNSKEGNVPITARFFWPDA